MQQAIRKRVRVLPGGRVEFTDPRLREGAEAEVIVLLPETAGDGAASEAPHSPPLPDEPPPLPLTEIIGSGTGLFATPEEVDEYIRALRDEWD